MRVFVSHMRTEATNALVRRLREAGADVDESPSPFPPTWYKIGLPATVDRCDVFVITLSETWGSTWMAIEWCTALRRFERDASIRIFRWDVDRVFSESEPPYYVACGVPLPLDPDEAARVLLRSGPAPGAQSPG